MAPGACHWRMAGGKLLAALGTYGSFPRSGGFLAPMEMWKGLAWKFKRCFSACRLAVEADCYTWNSWLIEMDLHDASTGPEQAMLRQLQGLCLLSHPHRSPVI